MTFQEKLEQAAYKCATETQVYFNHNLSDGSPIQSALGVGFHMGASFAVYEIVGYLRQGEAHEHWKLADEIAKLFGLGR